MKLVSLLFLCLLLINSCGDDDESAPTAVDTSTTGSTVLNNATSSIDSIGERISSATSSALRAAPISSRTFKFASSECDSGSGADQPADLSSAISFVVCLFDTNSQSPDTFQGALWLGATIMSETESLMTYQYETSATTHNDLTVNVGSELTISVQERALDSSNFWDFRIDIDTANATFSSRTHTLWLKDSNGQFGAKLFEVDDANPSNNLWIFLVNRTNQEIRYENWDNKNSRHTRIFAKGTISSTGTVSALTDIAMIHADGGISVGTTTGSLLVNSADGTNIRVNTYANDGTTGIDGCQGSGCADNPAHNSAFYNSTAIDVSSLDDNNAGELTFTRENIDMSQNIQL